MDILNECLILSVRDMIITALCGVSHPPALSHPVVFWQFCLFASSCIKTASQMSTKFPSHAIS